MEVDTGASGNISILTESTVVNPTDIVLRTYNWGAATNFSNCRCTGGA